MFQDPLIVALMCAAVSALAGLSRAMRIKPLVNWREASSLTLYAGVFGFCYGMVSAEWMKSNPYLLIGTSGLVGLGGAGLIEFVLAWLKGRASIVIRLKDEGESEDESDN